MMRSVRNKIICITGATSGIGAACAIAAAKAGAKLLLIGRRKQQLQQISEQCYRHGAADAYSLSLDVRDPEAIKIAFAQLPTDWRVVDVLINNAGLALNLDHLDEADVADWQQMIDTNIKGVLYLIHQLLPDMKQRNQGQIINIGSISSYITYPGGSVYCASKFAVRAISKGLRQELLGHNIRVNLVSPGAVNTEFSTVRFKGDRAKADATYQGMQPLQAEDIAATVMFCLEQPSHVNIEEILVMPLAQTAGGTMIHREDI